MVSDDSVFHVEVLGFFSLFILNSIPSGLQDFGKLVYLYLQINGRGACNQLVSIKRSLCQI